jgi:hypothetical protein
VSSQHAHDDAHRHEHRPRGHVYPPEHAHGHAEGATHEHDHAGAPDHEHDHEHRPPRSFLARFFGAR